MTGRGEEEKRGTGEAVDKIDIFRLFSSSPPPLFTASPLLAKQPLR
jgi:hypothetical protein